MNLEEFQEKIEYKFKNIKLLKNAFTHTSYANENRVESNEKLEFLGDAILEFVISNYLFNNYHNLKEGNMTKVRAAVVCEKSLYKVALKYDFGQLLYLGKSEKKSNGDKKPAILADSVEAVIAAIYEDAGLRQAEKFILDNLKTVIATESRNAGEKDYKTVLQEELQKNGNVDIQYNIIDEKGPDHDKSFIAEVKFNGKCLARGVGKTKKEAEMQAAKQALENI